MTKRLIFMGTPDFAVPALQKLYQHRSDCDPVYEIAAVVTQPDRKSGRGRKLAAPAVKQCAQSLGLSVLQPFKMSEIRAALTALAPDLIIVAAFGHILRPKILNLPPFGCLNIHASLLPRWRGASPVTAAIRAGDVETGVTLMQMGRGLDTGPILSQAAIPIKPQHTGGSLTDDLAHLGADLLIKTLADWFANKITPQPQNEAQATLAPKINKEDGRLNWQQGAIEIERHVRAYTPWPGTWTTWRDKPLKIISVSPRPDWSGALSPGQIFWLDKAVAVATADGAVILDQVQAPGKRAMPTPEFVRGASDFIGVKGSIDPFGDTESERSYRRR